MVLPNRTFNWSLLTLLTTTAGYVLKRISQVVYVVRHTPNNAASCAARCRPPGWGKPYFLISLSAYILKADLFVVAGNVFGEKMFFPTKSKNCGQNVFSRYLLKANTGSRGTANSNKRIYQAIAVKRINRFSKPSYGSFLRNARRYLRICEHMVILASKLSSHTE